MRAREFLKEATTSVSQMKSAIINQISNTNDKDLVEKIYTVLNKTGLASRISPILKRDTDTGGYIDQLVNIIIDTPGTYEEKKTFIDGYPHGYVDINLMLSGKYVKFQELIKANEDNPTAPIQFVLRVFDALKQVTFGTSKGPGEFALAVLSPRIKITGKGDLNIVTENGPEVVEVKTATSDKGGRVGTPGLLRSDNIPKIIEKYTGLKFGAGAGLNLKQLSATMDSVGLDQATKETFANELFDYIFKGEADIAKLVNAVVSGSNPNPYYLKANYELYKKESGFSGIMLMHFPSQSLKYFKDPLQMAQEIYAFSVYLVSSSPSHTAREILSQVTLKPIAEPSGPATPLNKKSSKKSVTSSNKKSSKKSVTSSTPVQSQSNTVNNSNKGIPMGAEPTVPSSVPPEK